MTEFVINAGKVVVRATSSRIRPSVSAKIVLYFIIISGSNNVSKHRFLNLLASKLNFVFRYLFSTFNNKYIVT